ncbi:MAG: hypothetical protein LPK09_15340 [Hymenobacteraceae bacterium]|nr:hypothetical protein [Hymenobacteraceae bacterium]
MRQPQHFPGKTLRFLLLAGFFIPFLVASFTSQFVGATLFEKAIVFGMVFLFSCFFYWIVAKTITQLLEE